MSSGIHKRASAKGSAKPKSNVVAAPSPQFELGAITKQLDKHPGEPQQVAVSPDDIGGELLALLSKGLYTNPLDSIREYVQNAVDAAADAVTITLSGTSVTIFDDGIGMSLDDILHARQFGLSSKSLTQHVGFRGIGIYSGFDLCQRLVITSLKEADDHYHILTFDFGAMRKQLELDRQKKSSDKKTSLTELLSQHTALTRQESTFPRDQHFTSVELQQISDTHLRQLSNRKELRRYLLQNLPIDFAESFPFAKKIRAFLKQSVPGYNAVTVKLKTEGQKDEIVAKYAEEDLHVPKAKLEFQEVRFGTIKNLSKETVAVIWSLLNSERSRIQPRPHKKSPFSTYFDDRPDYEGFVYKVKGFTIGDRRKLQATFKRKPMLYPWYTGEIYVTDSNVIPNAERHDFETNQARRALDLLVLGKMEDLEKAAELFQARAVAEERLAKYTSRVAALSAELDRDDRQDDQTTFSELADALKDLQRQKRNLDVDQRSEAEELIKRVKKLQLRIQKRAESEIEAKERAERARRGEGESAKADSEDEKSEAGKGGADEKEYIRFLDMLEEAGWDLDSDVGLFAEMVQESLEAVLGPESTEYELIVNDLAARIADASDEDEDD